MKYTAWFRPRSAQGSVLITVVWMLILLSIFSVSVGRRASQALSFGAWVRDHSASLALAKAGVERAKLEIQEDSFLTFDAFNESWSENAPAFQDIALGPGTFSVRCGDPDVQGRGDLDEKGRYGVCDEASRININSATEAVLIDLFRLLMEKADLADLQKLAHAIIDWRDGDDAEMTQGAEGTYYKSLREPYAIANRNFESIQELLLVKGITPEIFGRIEPYITVYTDGKVNFNTASAFVLRALGLSPELAAKIVEFRKGADQILGNKDDEIFQAVEAITPSVSAAMSFSGDEFEQITSLIAQGLVSVQSQVFRIHSVGRLLRNDRSFETQVTAVLNRNGTILYWQEG